MSIAIPQIVQKNGEYVHCRVKVKQGKLLQLISLAEFLQLLYKLVVFQNQKLEKVKHNIYYSN